MDFQEMQTRLLAYIQSLVHNGEFTERRMARVAGISQPHIHNVLKGARTLSPAMADQLIHRLHIDLLDLVAEAREGASLPKGFCTVPLLDGWIGPDSPYPSGMGEGYYPFPAADVERLVSPVAARLAGDPAREPQFRSAGAVLLECAERLRLNPDEQCYYALDLDGAGAIGLVRRCGAQWCLWERDGDTGRSRPLPDRYTLDLIKGKVILAVQEV